MGRSNLYEEGKAETRERGTVGWGRLQGNGLKVNEVQALSMHGTSMRHSETMLDVYRTQVDQKPAFTAQSHRLTGGQNSLHQKVSHAYQVQGKDFTSLKSILRFYNITFLALLQPLAA